MLEGFLAQILSDIYRHPRILLHLTIVSIALILLGYAGIYLPLSIVDTVGLGSAVSREGGVLVAVDLVVALTALFTYLALVATLFSSISKALNKALERLDLRDSLSTIDKLRNSCFVEDIVATNKAKERRWGTLILLLLFSVAVILSYYLSIAFFLYALNDWLGLIGIPLLQLLSSSRYIAFLAVVVLALVVATLMLIISLRWGLDVKEEGYKGVFEEWFEDLTHKYLFRNCMGKRGSVVLASLAPLILKHKVPYLRWFTLAVPHSLAGAIFKKLVSSGESQYSIKNYEAFKECIDKPLDMEKLKEGIFKNLCIAKLYVKEGEKEKYLGILIAFTATVIAGRKHPLRYLSDYKVIVSVKPEEKQTHIVLLAVDPSAAEFITRLVTG